MRSENRGFCSPLLRDPKGFAAPVGPATDCPDSLARDICSHGAVRASAAIMLGQRAVTGLAAHHTSESKTKTENAAGMGQSADGWKMVHHTQMGAGRWHIVGGHRAMHHPHLLAVHASPRPLLSGQHHHCQRTWVSTISSKGWCLLSIRGLKQI